MRKESGVGMRENKWEIEVGEEIQVCVCVFVCVCVCVFIHFSPITLL
jgi:dolichyl-phosphate-mannose--protein O-mannosyl transferase